MKASEKYKLMSRAERRVAICKDVIKAINAKKFMGVARGTGYIVGPKSDRIDHEYVKKHSRECTVCARGAMMLTRLDRYNGKSIHCNPDESDDWHTTIALEDAFSVEQLDQIENVLRGKLVMTKLVRERRIIASIGKV